MFSILASASSDFQRGMALPTHAMWVHPLPYTRCFFLPTPTALCLLMSSAVITYAIVILTDRPSLLAACSGARWRPSLNPLKSTAALSASSWSNFVLPESSSTVLRLRLNLEVQSTWLSKMTAVHYGTQSNPSLSLIRTLQGGRLMLHSTVRSSTNPSGSYDSARVML